MLISGSMNTGPVLAFVDCEIDASAGAGGGSGPVHAHGRREVVISGKRVKTVDVHAHCIVPEAAQLINHSPEASGLLWSNIGDPSGADGSNRRRCPGAQHQSLLVPG